MMTINQMHYNLRGIPRSNSDNGGFASLYRKHNLPMTPKPRRDSIESARRRSSIPRPSPSSRQTSTTSNLSSSLQDEDIRFLAAANNIYPQRRSSIAPSFTAAASLATNGRTSSRLPRPTSSTTTFREPITPTPGRRIAMFTKQHKLRVSMTTNDLAALQEETTPKDERKENRRPSDLATSPSKLPRRVVNGTPLGRKGTGEKRYVSTPASLPSHKKENVIPIGLLRPVSPTQAQSQVHAHVQALQPPVSAKSQFQYLQTQIAPTMHPLQPTTDSKSNIPQRSIPKSRTVGILSNLRSTFRRSRSSLNFEHKSRNSSISSAATTSTKNRDSTDLTLTAGTEEGQHIYGYHTTGFWAGRFSSLHDRLHNELLEASLGDAAHFEAYISKIGIFPSMTNKPRPISTSSSTTFSIILPTSNRVSTTSTKLKTSTTESALYRDETPLEQLEARRFTAAAEDARCKRVLSMLNMYCGDEGAKKSLYTFQLQFARIKGKPEFLPEGGKMEPLLERWGKKVEGAFGKRSSTRLN